MMIIIIISYIFLSVIPKKKNIDAKDFEYHYWAHF